uniref:DUF8039 domain-containing protein n=1 Tax=Oryza brachyantha TaxID=4533 RepID=J3L2H7_ORYBR
MSDNQDITTSAGTSATTGGRPPKSRNRLPESKLTITVVDLNGNPTQPPTITSNFASSCGVVARECIGILQKTFKEVLQEEKEFAWEKLKEKFDYPPEAGLALKRQVLIKIDSSWKKFKSMLVNESMERIPKLKNSPEFVNISDDHKRLQARNVHPHLLGTGGYIGKTDRWAEEDEAARRSGGPVSFADLEEERARNWARARAKKNPDDTLMFPNQADADVFRQMQLFADISPCVLQVRVMAKFSSDAAEGLVFKPSKTIRVHGAQLLDGHAKVQVDRVLDGWATFPLEHPPIDEILTLDAAKGTYIQWPKHDIIIRMKPKAPPIPEPMDSMPPPDEPNVEVSIGQALTDPHFGSGPALETIVRASSSPSMTYQKKYTKGRRWGKGSKKPALAKKLDMGKRAVPSGVSNKGKAKQFVLGWRLVDDLALTLVGQACQDLHAWYMTTTSSKCQNMDESVVGSHGCEPFLSPMAMFVVGFNDLWDLFNLTQLDTGLLKCYSLRHWILICICPKWNMVYYLNSAISPIYTWIPIKEALERAWEPYVTKGGKHDAKRSGLTHKFDFPIAQQTGLMCGFHVCHHMSNLSQQVNTFDPECRLLRDRYPKPLIFHDGHLAFLPTPSAVLAFFLFPPLGVTLSVIRISIGIVVSYKISFSAGAVFGVRFRTSGLRALEPGVKRRGILYVCTHRTLVDPIMLTAALQKPVPTMTYSLSQLSEIIAPISTVRLTRDRVRDAETMSCLLEHGDLTVCPEGTTC